MPSTLSVEHQRRLTELSERALRAAEALWVASGVFVSGADETFYAGWEPLWQGFVAAAYTDAVVNIQSHSLVTFGEAGFTPTAPDNVNDWSAALRGVAAPEVYRRPFLEAWANESADMGWAKLSAITETDLQLAARVGEYEAMAGNSTIVGYRRVLGAPPNCGLCVVASTQRYRKDALKPIHSRCKCGTQPIYRDREFDPGRGRVSDQDTLDRVKQLVPESYPDGRELKRVRFDGAAFPDVDRLPDVDIGINGELGPVLVNAAHNVSTLTP